jgi:PAS domain S-box-containing protein/putative nucleotidyltransferase with HDIG domain
MIERRQDQAELERSARRFRKLIEGGADVFFLIDQSGNMLYRSPAGVRLTGWSDDEVLGKGIVDHVVPEDLPLAQSALADAIGHPDKTTHVELRLRHKDGSVRVVDVAANNLLADPDVGGIVLTARDITERKRAELEILDSEAKFRGVVDQSLVAITIFQDGRYTYANHRALEMFGYGADEFMRLLPTDLVDDADRPRVLEGMRLRETAGVPAVHYTFQGRRKDGALIEVEIHGTSMELGGKRALTAVMMDVTESRRAQHRAEESEAKLSAILGAIGDGVGVVDPQTRRLLSGTSAFCEMLGYRPEEIPKLSIADLHPAESLPSVMAQFARQITGEIKVATDLPVKRKDGSVFVADISASAATIGGKPQMVAVFHDVTGRKRTEEQLRRLNWALRALSQSNSALVHSGSEDELFRSCCAAIANAEGYALAWVGIGRDDPGKSIEIVAAAGAASAYLDAIEISWADTPLGQGPTGTAIRTCTTQLVNDIATSAAYLPWLAEARAHGLASSIALPIRLDGGTCGALSVYSTEQDAFSADEVKLLEEMAGDISYGIGTRRTRRAYEASIEERAHQAIRLRETLESAIGALAATVEQRDPYTAGHQRRVAELAVAIGREMGFADDRLTGLHVAGIIHDIGKISVPAEILSRPGKLSAVEFELIKGHAQAGYEIIKGVDFPWPVAQAIRQHHERLDGSGYPQGLKGDQVILEARILAVADVVEAMSSHRPYRPGLGVGFALKELEDKRGLLFDPAVVDACLRAFRERNFAFAS